MTGRRTDDELDAFVQAVPVDAWDHLAVLVDRLARAEQPPYEWRGGPQPDGSIAVPYVEYGPALADVRAWLSEAGLVTPVADWTNWSELDRYREPLAVLAAPAADAVRLATAIVRSERFSEGSIAGAFDSGVLGALLRRLLDLSHRPDGR